MVSIINVNINNINVMANVANGAQYSMSINMKINNVIYQWRNGVSIMSNGVINNGVMA
jgi:hypothetical protein